MIAPKGSRAAATGAGPTEYPTHRAEANALRSRRGARSVGCGASARAASRSTRRRRCVAAAAGAALPMSRKISATNWRHLRAPALSRRPSTCWSTRPRAPSGADRLERRHPHGLAALDSRRNADTGRRAHAGELDRLSADGPRGDPRAPRRGRGALRCGPGRRGRRTRCGGSATSSGWRAGSAVCARRRATCLKLGQALAAVATLKQLRSGDAAQRDAPRGSPRGLQPQPALAAQIDRDDQRRAAGKSARRQRDPPRLQSPRSTSCARSRSTRAA